MKLKKYEIQALPIGSVISTIEKIGSSKDAAQLCRDAFNENTIAVKESFFVFALDRANNVKGVYELSTGAISSCTVDILLIAKFCVDTLAQSVIISHNHPSGALKPSVADTEITKKIKAALSLLDVVVIDHIILTPSGEHYSFADEGMI